MTSVFAHEERLSYLEKYGSHCLAYSTLQPGMDYFDLPGVGYVAYMPKWGTRYVLTDPVCASQNFRTVLDALLREHPRICCVQVSEDFADVLARRGFLVNSLGVENTITLDDFRISWNTRRDLKRWVSSLSKAGIQVQEGRNGISCAEIKEVSDEWLRSKLVHREMAFMARPYSLAEEELVRTFFAKQDGRLLAFCSFDPVFNRCLGGGGHICFAICGAGRAPRTAYSTTLS